MRNLFRRLLLWWEDNDRCGDCPYYTVCGRWDCRYNTPDQP